MVQLAIKNNRRAIDPLMVGDGCPTAIKLQVGVTAGFSSLQSEVEKVLPTSWGTLEIPA